MFSATRLVTRGGQLATVHEQQQTAELFVITTPTLYPLNTGPVKRVTSAAASFAWRRHSAQLGWSPDVVQVPQALSLLG